MTSGIPLSEEEKETIRRGIPTKSKRQLAKELQRNPLTIRHFVQQEKLED